ncbi:MAG: ADP-forming succinate--CoA ligase subunit beta [Deltaproteobacteria bacterium]|nr:ADP-forming succinate--CoA ligase subunit beta [Deltaproteobacteria bacterium]
MNIHEYQAKQWLARFGVPVPQGRVAATAEEARAAAREIGFPCVVKAQIHAGGRGKAGGVKVVHNEDDAAAFAEDILGKPLVTHQTGPEGRIVRRVWVEEAFRIAREIYCSIVLDAAAGGPAIIACREGGMEIEEVARETPDAIIIEVVDPLVGVQPFQVRRVAAGLGLTGKEVSAFGALVRSLYDAFLKSDCMQLEINPLAQLDDGRLLVLDAKMNFDGNALFRQADVAELRDITEEDPKEVRASDLGISYVALDGNIGCMVNGAGLAMGTMDIIQQYGGMPANFLDVGGGASKEMVGQAFRLLLSDDKVRGVLVNIFGGIMRCDVIAAGVIDAAREIGVSVPLVVRLQGTNVEQGRELLSKSDLSIIAADTIADAAQKIVEAVRAEEGRA